MPVDIDILELDKYGSLDTDGYVGASAGNSAIAAVGPGGPGGNSAIAAVGPGPGGPSRTVDPADAGSLVSWAEVAPPASV